MSLSFEINPRFLLDSVHETKQNFQPIYCYEQEPLVSLEEACQPLENMLGTELSLYINVAKLNSKEPKQGLTQDESASIYLYTMEWNQSQNSLYYKYLKLLFTALFKLPYTEQHTVWRGVAKDVSEHYREGDELTWRSLTSATSSIDVLQSPMYLDREKVQTIFVIETKHGKSIQAHSHLVNDNEILLLPGIVLKVIGSSTKTDGIHIIHLRDVESFDSLILNPIPQLNQYRNPRLEEVIRASETRSKLSLESMNLNDQDMEIVVKLGIVEKQCMILNLTDNAITSVGTSILSQVFLDNQTFKSLILDRNRILDAGVEFIARGLANANLCFRTLYLDSVGMSDTSCEYLAEMIRRNHGIIYLWLNNNEISDRGVQVLFETIKSCDCGIVMIALSGNTLTTDASVDIICSAMFENRAFHQIHICNCGLSTAGKERLQVAAQQTSFILYV
ncbi:unnamed protein product [Adineta steineri]|uniref:NAD(P)(+)--arginine ADP-ribosyltransferase n=2 Tax=Adineta steineri TaxID=433720 RepID=A0A813ZLY9_9BILA|nr:unnamed protein product [Adineta steineri]